MLCIRYMHNTILWFCILLSPVYHNAGAIPVCLCVLLHPRYPSIHVFVTGAIPFYVAVQCIVMPPSRCRTSKMYSGQVQYHSVS